MSVGSMEPEAERRQVDEDDFDDSNAIEQMPEFDDFDDDFVVNEEQWTARIAYYLDEHIDQFAIIEK